LDPTTAREALLRLVREPPQPFPFDSAALCIAAIDLPELSVAPYSERLDSYASRVREAVGYGSPDARRYVGALRRVVFEEEGFHGNREQYYDIRNSYLNMVMDRKLGLPITLGVLLLGIARRLEWPLTPVNFPAHFLLRWDDGEELLAVDPFHGALILDDEELGERWRMATGSPAPSSAVMLRPTPAVSVLVRMVNNIRLVYLETGSYGNAARATEKVAWLEPEVPEHRRDTGLLYLAAGLPIAAEPHLRAYLKMAPEAPDAETIRAKLPWTDNAAEM
jgi:regulator of sirC expression with transglutaminase-like and TPR domain